MLPLCPDVVIHALGVLEPLAHTLLQASECFSAVTLPVCVVNRVALGLLPPRWSLHGISLCLKGYTLVYRIEQFYKLH